MNELFFSSESCFKEVPLSLLCVLCRSAPSSPDVSPQSSPRPPRANNDRLTLLTRLVRKGEKKGLFVEKMPASIYQVTSNLCSQHGFFSCGSSEETSTEVCVCVLHRW